MGLFTKDNRRYFIFFFVATNIKDGLKMFSDELIEVNGYLNRKNIIDAIKYKSENPNEWEYTLTGWEEMSEKDFKNFDKNEIKDDK